MSKIFISHSSKDNLAADALRIELEANNHSLFLDFDGEKGIAAGRDWAKELYRHLRICQAVVVLCSEHSMASMWCFAEIIHAESLGKPIFPIKVGPCDIHPILQRHQVLDLTADGGKDTAYRKLLRGLKMAGLDPADDFSWESSRSPYPGLPAFTADDAGVYFGRDTEIQHGLDMLKQLRQFGGARMLMVLGASGSGKSSLVRAGLMPRLQRNPREWLVVPTFRPQQEPLKELSIALSQAFSEHGETRDWKTILELLTSAAGDKAGQKSIPADLARDLQQAAGQRDSTILLVLDQTEELLGDSDATTDSFLELLHAFLSGDDSRWMVIATLRSDFLAAFQQNRAAARLKIENLNLTPMSEEALLNVIEGPAQVADLNLEDGLARRMVDATATQDALPLLAFTLRELYENYGADRVLRNAEYDEIGGLEGSVARSAEKLISNAALNEAQEKDLQSAFLSLARLDEEGHFVRRLADRDRMPAQTQVILEQFVQARLLISRDDDGRRILEVAHEAIFRSWKRLRGWLDEARELLLWRKRLSARLEEWERTARNAGNLLTGPALEESRRWLGLRAHQLDDNELELIRESIRVDDDRLAVEERRQRTIRSRQLALQSRAQAPRNHELALLLAIESGLATDSIEAEGALRAALQHPWQTRKLLSGHLDHVVGIAWDPAGRYVLSASLDGTAAIWDTWSGEQSKLLSGHKAKVWHAAWSPDGESILTVSLDGTARLWSAASGRTRSVLKGHLAPLQQGAWSEDGQSVVTVAADNTARRWDVQSGEALGEPMQHDDFVRCVCWQGERIATGGFDREVRVWDGSSGALLAKLSGHTHAISHVAWSPDGSHLLSAGEDGTVHIWTLAEALPVEVHIGHRGEVVHACWSPCGKRVLSVGRDGTARVRSLHQDQADFVLRGHQSELTRGAWCADGLLIATSSLDGTARVWEAKNGRLDAVLTGHQAGVVTIAWMPDRQQLATASLDNTVRLWSAAEGSRLLRVGAAVIWRASWSGDGERVASVGNDGRVMVYAMDNGGRDLELAIQDAQVLDVAWSPDDRLLATACGDGSAGIWDAASGERIAALSGHQSIVRLVSWSPDGLLLATAGHDSHFNLWSASGELLATLEGHAGGVQHLAWSPDSKSLLSTSLDSSICLWDVRSQQQLRQFEGHSSAVLHAAWSPDGRWIASASSDRTVRIWEAATGKLGHLLTDHQDWVLHLAWNSDGTLLASAGRDGRVVVSGPALDADKNILEGHTAPVRQVRWKPGDDARLLTVSDDNSARLWSLEGDQIALLEGHTQGLTSGEWHPSGSHILTASHDGSVRVFFAAFDQLMDEAKRRAVRDLTPEEWRLFIGGPMPAARVANTETPVSPITPAIGRKTLAVDEQPVLGGIVLLDSPWGDEVAAGMRAGAAEAGAELILKRHHFKFLKETEFIQDFIDIAVDGLVLVPQREEESVFMLKQACEAGIVVVNVAISLNPRDTARYVSAFYESDNEELGYRTGSFLAEWVYRHSIPQPVQVGIIHSGIYGVSNRRARGFRAALKDAGLSWDETVSLQGINIDEASDSVQKMVAEYPGVEVIWADNSENTIGATKGLRSVKRPVHLFGTEINLEVAQALLAEGALEAVTSQVTFEMSRKAVHAAVNILRGNDTGHHHRIMPSILFTREQPKKVHEFLELQKARINQWGKK